MDPVLSVVIALPFPLSDVHCGAGHSFVLPFFLQLTSAMAVFAEKLLDRNVFNFSNWHVLLNGIYRLFYSVSFVHSFIQTQLFCRSFFIHSLIKLLNISLLACIHLVLFTIVRKLSRVIHKIGFID